MAGELGRQGPVAAPRRELALEILDPGVARGQTGVQHRRVAEPRAVARDSSRNASSDWSTIGAQTCFGAPMARHQAVLTARAVVRTMAALRRRISTAAVQQLCREPLTDEVAPSCADTRVYDQGTAQSVLNRCAPF